MRILLCGDIHGYAFHAVQAIDQAYRLKADAVVQLGDFGYGMIDGKVGNDEYLKIVSHSALYYEIPFYFIDGNHENHSSLLRHP